MHVENKHEIDGRNEQFLDKDDDELNNENIIIEGWKVNNLYYLQKHDRTKKLQLTCL